MIASDSEVGVPQWRKIPENVEAQAPIDPSRFPEASSSPKRVFSQSGSSPELRLRLSADIWIWIVQSVKAAASL